MKITKLNTIFLNQLNEISLDDCAAIYGGHGRPLIWRDKRGAWCRRMIGGGTACRLPGVD